MPLDVKNFTGALERAEAFVRAKGELVATDGLSIHIKFTKARGRDVAGYYRWNDRRMVLAVKRRLRYPRNAAYGIGTRPRPATSAARVPYRLVWHEERFESPDDLLVFVAGHEFWHFLCHSGQRKRDHETKANCNGFAWLREFRVWVGPGQAVAAIPMVPPVPGMQVSAAAAPETTTPRPFATVASAPAASVVSAHSAPSARSTPSASVVSAHSAPSTPSGRARKPARPVPVQLELF